MKQVLKVLMWIVILGAVCFGIYLILPEYPHDFVKSFVQPVVNSQAKTRITQIQTLNNQDVNANYKDILEKSTGMSCWVYETREEEPGVEYVIYRGNGATINIKDVEGYNDMLYTSCVIKFEFKISGNNVEIIPYIDGTKIAVENTATSKDTNDLLKKIIISQLYGVEVKE